MKNQQQKELKERKALKQSKIKKTKKAQKQKDVSEFETMNDTVSQPWAVDITSPPDFSMDKNSDIKINSPPEPKLNELKIAAKYKNLKKSELLLRKIEPQVSVIIPKSRLDKIVKTEFSP